MLGEKGDFSLEVVMKRLTIFLVFLIFAGFVNLHSLGRYIIEEPFERGDFSAAYVTIRNPINTKIEDVNVKFYVYDLGLRFSSLSDDVSKRDSVVQRVPIYIPERVKPGDYLTKITVGNDHYRDTQHVYLKIV